MRWTKLVAILLPATMATACDDASNTGQARVFLSVTDEMSASVATASLDYVANTQPLTLEAVDSLFLRVTSVALLPQGGDSNAVSASWIEVQAADSAGKMINVLKLTEEDSLLLAKGDLPAGDYHNMRLFFDSATIVLKEDVTVGGHLFEQGTVYPLRVPSGVVKVPLAKFTVGADSVSTLNLELRERPSVANVVATGSGVLQLTPVLHVK